MRPGSQADITTRSRKSSVSDGMPIVSNRPTSFFLTRDPEVFTSVKEGSTLNQELESSPVRSLKETLEEAARHSKHVPLKPRQHENRSQSRRRSTIRPQILDEFKAQQYCSVSQGSLELLTPSLLPSREVSLPSSPKSMSSQSVQRSDEESIAEDNRSQAIISDNECDQDSNAKIEAQDSAPQLIMPSIKMPSRRPFTANGRQLGRFKILVAGTKGSGRTSLIKSIVQICEDIVHVDPMFASTTTGSKNALDDFSVNEIYASTKPYPAWWSDLDESRILRRQKNMGTSVLERNICFADTVDSGKPEIALGYIEEQFFKTINIIHQPGGDVAGILSGRGGSQVDLVLYLLTQDTLQHDITQIQKLSVLTNVIPLISKADLLSTEHIQELKSTSDLNSNSLPQLSATASYIHVSPPFSVSSINGPDFDNMDASLLMSPEYIQPLMPSELALLVEQIFEPEMVDYLRHSAAKKLCAWYRSGPKLTEPPSPSIHTGQPSTLHSPLQTSLSQSGQLVPVTSHLSLNTSNSYALAKVADHTQREEHLAQVRLCKWAADLQLSLQRERERYENVARSERAMWLVQKMGEEVRDGRIVPLEERDTAMVRTRERSGLLDHGTPIGYEIQDPLGLLQWQDQLRARGWVVLQVIGSFGVVGGVAIWLAKTWGLTTSFHEYIREIRTNWLEYNEKRL